MGLPRKKKNQERKEKERFWPDKILQHFVDIVKLYMSSIEQQIYLATKFDKRENR